MRLLNAKTIELVQFLPNQIPPYAILSHTWSTDPDEEVLFSDVGQEEAKQKPAYQQKVVPACRKALKHGFNYVWIDTCCIDKRSSAELQEAVNSMFKWYLHSSICFVYLEDVPSKRDESMDSGIGDCLIIKSRWFTRGWTLQELVAPGNIIFYSKYWDELGTRALLANLVSEKTRIDEKILTESILWHRQNSIFDKSVANRMSWAAFRETTRPEDIAYCLIGIFGVNMPLLYGEGEEKAFLRLQEEILKDSDDQSLLAWTPSSSSRRTTLCGPFAKHPIEFRDSSCIVPLPGVSDTYSLTSSGLRIDLLVSSNIPFQPGVWGVLRCHYKNDFTGPLAIPLVPQSWQGNHVYARRSSDLTTIDRLKLTGHDIFQNGPFRLEHQAHSQIQTILIQKKPESLEPECKHFHLEDWPSDCTLIKAIPECQWNSKSRIMVTDHYDVTRVLIFEHVISKTRFAIVFAYSFRYPEDSLSMVKVFELDPDKLDIPSWLQDWESETLIYREWSDEEFEDCSDTTVYFRRKSLLQGIQATLRKGHIMGVPFFIGNVQILTNSTASI
jgi:hypothetical protein